MSTVKEKVWLSHYYKCFNATEAARLANFKWPNKIGPRLKDKFADEIKQHFDELQMSADEAMIRLADMARSDIAAFTEIESPADLRADEYKGKTHVIKKFKKQTVYTKSGDTIVTTELELYDAQAGLVNVLKVHGRFKDIHSITTFAFPAELWPHATPEDINALAEADGPAMMAIAAAIKERLAAGGQGEMK